jgi:hypothetical protein
MGVGKIRVLRNGGLVCGETVRRCGRRVVERFGGGPAGRPCSMCEPTLGPNCQCNHGTWTFRVALGNGGLPPTLRHAGAPSADPTQFPRESWFVLEDPIVVGHVFRVFETA